MFPGVKQRLGAAVLNRVDLLVELATLGEYGLTEVGLSVRIGEELEPVEPARPRARLDPPFPRGRMRAACPKRGAATPQRCEPPARL